MIRVDCPEQGVGDKDEHQTCRHSAWAFMEVDPHTRPTASTDSALGLDTESDEEESTRLSFLERLRVSKRKSNRAFMEVDPHTRPTASTDSALGLDTESDEEESTRSSFLERLRVSSMKSYSSVRTYTLHGLLTSSRLYRKELSRDSEGTPIVISTDDKSDNETPGPSGAVLPVMSIAQKTERRQPGGQPPENKGEVEDMCHPKGRESNGDVQVFTPETSDSERTTYRFCCRSAGVHQCRYSGLIFKTDTAAEVHYQTVPWDYKKLKREGLMAAGPLFKMKGLQGSVSQLGFPHCEIISCDKTPSFTVIHMKDKTFERLQPLRTSDTHVFLTITGFCKFGLTKEQHSEGTGHHRIRALVLLFLDHLTLNVLLLPKNIVLKEVFEKRRMMTQPRTEIYIDTPSKCKLIPYEEYSLTCSSENNRVTPKISDFDVKSYEDYFPTFQVALSSIEPIDLHLLERRHNENNDDNKNVWQSYVNLQNYAQRATVSESTLWSPYTPLGKDFFRKHKSALESRLGLLRPILCELERRGVLNPQERQDVESKEGSLRNRTLLRMLEDKGGLAQEEFYSVLLGCDRYLVKDLEKPYDVRTSAEFTGFRKDISSHRQVAY